MAEELLCDYKNRLIEKHDYSEDFAQDLAVMTESLAEYYGPEYSSLVYDAVLSTKYVVAGRKPNSNVYETVFDVLKRENMLEPINGEDPLEQQSSLKHSRGTATTRPSISYDGSEYHVDRVDRIVALPHYFDANNPDSMANISRETMRIINNYLKGYEIEGHTLSVHDGLATTTQKLSLSEEGQVTRTPKEKKGTGLEEGMVKYDELCFVRSYYDANYDSPQEPTARLIAGYLSDSLGLKDMLREAQITKDTIPLQSAIDAQVEESYTGLVSRLDNLQNLEILKSKYITDVDKFPSIEEDIKNKFTSEIAPIVQRLGASISLDEDFTKRI